MPEKDTGRKALVDVEGAAAYLSLSEDVVLALMGAGFLHADAKGAKGPEFNQVSLKAFLARNADNGAGNVLDLGPESVDPQSLLDALEGRSDEMARRAYEIFAAAFPEARAWSLSERAGFIEQASARFEAILAVTGQGAEADETLVADLCDVGAAAAWAGSPLPQLLVMLRISRDLVVQSAVELAEAGGRHWGLALSLLLERVLPAMDRLTDALAKGYWGAVVGRDAESRTRFEDLVESSFNGICEVDLEGTLRYANAALSVIFGLSRIDLEGASLGSVLAPIGTTRAEFVSAAVGSPDQVHRLSILRPDGVVRTLDVRVHPRCQGDSVTGYQWVFADVSAAVRLEVDKNRFLAHVTSELSRPLATIASLIATLDDQARTAEPKVSARQVLRTSDAIAAQTDRMRRMAQSLSDISRLQSSQLFLAPQVVDLASVTGKAVALAGSLAGVEGGIEVSMGPETLVWADPDRLEQVISNLVSNALEHGGPPVSVRMRPMRTGGFIEVEVSDAGPGLDPAAAEDLFARPSSLIGRSEALAGSGGLGLVLSRDLMQAMGGRLWYEEGEGDRPSFCLAVPTQRRRASK
ncbi:MAG: ATP-binding protein [Acidimicrobiales bacterium]